MTTTASQAGTAEVIFIGGRTFTGHSDRPERLGVAIADGRILAVASDDEVRELSDASTRVVDLNGALLSAGFQDAHIHPTTGGVELLQCNLSAAADADEAASAIAEYAAANPDAEWIIGGGWSMDHFAEGTPTRQALDALVPDRPALLTNRDHHGAWANTLAFERAGITASTPDPADGRIEREADGTPAGTVHEGAMDLFDTVRPAATDELVYRGLLRAQRDLFALGVTGWQDALIGAAFGLPDPTDAYLRAVHEGELAAHVVGAQWWDRNAGSEQLDQLIARRDRVAAEAPAGSFSLGTVKIMVDGVAENFTAAMTAPYRDRHGHPTDNSGLSFIDPEKLKQYVTALDAAGFQVHFHALGDRAVREALDAIAAAREANGPTDNRHHLAHLQVVAESDAPRFAQLGATATLQSLWACHETQLDELTLPFLDEAAAQRQYPFGDLLAHGARLAAGSDWPVSSADPVAAIHVAVNRIAPGADAEPLGPPSERLDLATALTAYTAGSAWINHREHDTGAIAPGYLANLVVLDPNPFELEAAHIHTATVASTWVRGAEVYTRA